MEDAIRAVVERIEPHYAFDSHFVISQLIKRHSDVYIRFAGPDETTAQMHARIAHIIQATGLVRRLPQQSWSDNIHGSSTDCALWQRITVA